MREQDLLHLSFHLSAFFELPMERIERIGSSDSPTTMESNELNRTFEKLHLDFKDSVNKQS